MSKKVAKAIVALGRSGKLSPSQLSDAIIAANDAGTTAAELEAAAKAANERGR
jgi:hypothetical protein